MFASSQVTQSSSVRSWAKCCSESNLEFHRLTAGEGESAARFPHPSLARSSGTGHFRTADYPGESRGPKQGIASKTVHHPRSKIKDVATAAFLNSNEEPPRSDDAPPPGPPPVRVPRGRVGRVRRPAAPPAGLPDLPGPTVRAVVHVVRGRRRHAPGPPCDAGGGLLLGGRGRRSRADPGRVHPVGAEGVPRPTRGVVRPGQCRRGR
ncbi:hypothetical protein THAOC_04796 [Thalassiosira oceanica]|uniref:Uncharacterized protein n=1 Tax=Thalassiosira oceanica TaxID=159749 RepID=K0TNI8_THAOC|nr:hypothetical protein THAOC_04796 [Thalassiosira oceanica]|eukprot:EJK73572.1 hypothetical protein THAOC_04796 [Thalassiosira oceanica]